nr:class I SAM-dependent methyltransferase [Candidatus Njordarchaeota archaeon]
MAVLRVAAQHRFLMEIILRGKMAMGEKMYEYLCRKYSKEIDELEKVVLSPALKKKINPLFYDYFKSRVTNKKDLRNYFLASAAISKLLHMKGKKVLDVGCGFGLRLTCIALAGSQDAVGIDISGEMIQGFRTLLREFPQLRISTIKGDFLLADFPRDSFDVAIVQEAISHIRDTHLLLNKIKHVLRPGGILYVTDCNNDLFLPSRIRSRKNWKKSEFSSTGEPYARHAREVDKFGSFFEARMRIIRGRHPRLDEKKLAMIAKKTRGMYGEEIIEATEEFMNTGKISHKASFPYRNPFTGEFPELGINPFRLVGDMKRRGFRCRFLRPIGVYLGVTSGAPQWKAAVARRTLPILRNFPATLFPFLISCFQVVGVKDE